MCTANKVIGESKPFYTLRLNIGGIHTNVHFLDTKPRLVNFTEFDGQ